MAVDRGAFALAFFWLLVALAVDGVDGSFARAARVSERAPRIDGAALDLIIDYLNYVLVPAVIIWKAGLVPEPLAPIAAAAILVSSLYNFARRDMKTEDFYFRGFPALWNVVALYLFLAGLGGAAGFAIVLLLSALTFAPVHVVHPFRVRDFGMLLPILGSLWAASALLLLWPGWSPALRLALILLSAACTLAMIALGLVRTLRGPP